MNIAAYQERVDHWIKTYGVRYFDEKTNMILLTEEIGELSRQVARVYGEQSFKQEHKPEEIKEKLGDEMADILFVLTCLSNQMGIDLEDVIEKNFDKKTKRDKDRHTSNPKLG